jgi:hypothetical protein
MKQESFENFSCVNVLDLELLSPMQGTPRSYLEQKPAILNRNFRGFLQSPYKATVFPTASFFILHHLLMSSMDVP